MFVFKSPPTAMWKKSRKLMTLLPVHNRHLPALVQEEEADAQPGAEEGAHPE